ncbi:MAG: saccharopine dehydrogenase NADP-binding domain-containing protein [Elainella sp. Prado103]|nr:saccharopine dehydrogenase NADP-binding domain-containing protein [Elainella sp. Prado103]
MEDITKSQPEQHPHLAMERDQGMKRDRDDRPQVLILGGQGRIGQSVAADLLRHTRAQLLLTSRTQQSDRQSEQMRLVTVDLADHLTLRRLIAESQLVIHCAGPFRYRDTRVLEFCIECGVNYLDVSDDRTFTQRAMQHQAAATDAGVTAIVNTGVFPGISNSLVRLGVEQLDQLDRIHLSYVVAGSGGAGKTVMRTTFLGLQHPFTVFRGGEWQTVRPYTEPEQVEFPPPYGRSTVYWFDMPETLTLAHSFPAQTVITKFGSVPSLYNYLTWLTARFPASVIQDSRSVEFLATVSHRMTQISDRLTGIGVAMRAAVYGEKRGQKGYYWATFSHPNTAVAAGQGTGSIAQSLLSGTLHHPGVWAVEQALPTILFQQTLQERGLAIHQGWQPVGENPRALQDSADPLSN